MFLEGTLETHNCHEKETGPGMKMIMMILVVSDLVNKKNIIHTHRHKRKNTFFFAIPGFEGLITNNVLVKALMSDKNKP